MTIIGDVLADIKQEVVLADASANIIFANQAFLSATGYLSEEITGKNVSVLCHKEMGEVYFQNIREVLQINGSWQGELKIVKKNGDIYPVWACLSCITDNDGNIVRYSAIGFDISILKENEQRLEYMAHYDMLTSLPNRSLMYDRLKQALAHAKRYQYYVGVMLIDIDRFKEVNDVFGHHIGDQLLIEVARRLVKCVRESDTIARMGGDEFFVILPEVGSTTNAAHVAQKILDALSEKLMLEGNSLFVSGSIGLAMYPGDAEDIHMLVKNTDTAMYHAKAQGKNNFKFFTEGINKSTIERFRLEANFRNALEKLEFQLNYQPKIDMKTGRITGMEALLRWYHPEQGNVNPGLFIPLAEETGLVVQLGEWALKEACRQNRAWQDEGMP